MFRIRFVNSNDAPVYIQVDPWAGVYVLRKGDEIEIEAECQTQTPSFHIEEYQATRILVLVDCSEYFVIKDGKRLHWTEFATNVNE